MARPTAAQYRAHSNSSTLRSTCLATLSTLSGRLMAARAEILQARAHPSRSLGRRAARKVATLSLSGNVGRAASTCFRSRTSPSSSLSTKAWLASLNWLIFYSFPLLCHRPGLLRVYHIYPEPSIGLWRRLLPSRGEKKPRRMGRGVGSSCPLVGTSDLWALSSGASLPCNSG